MSLQDWLNNGWLILFSFRNDDCSLVAYHMRGVLDSQAIFDVGPSIIGHDD